MASAAGPSKRGCKQCGGRLVEDEMGPMNMLLCESCGVVASDDQLVLGRDNASDTEDLPDITTQSLGGLSQKVRGQSAYRTKREKALIEIINQMASDTHLKGRNLQMCKEEGVQLLRTKVKFQKLKYFAAGLVFVALKRQSSAATFKEVSQRTHIGQKPLGRMVKWLKKQTASASLKEITSADSGCTFSGSVQYLLDQLRLPADKASDAKRVALDLKLIVHGKLERPVSHSRAGDGAILLLALNHVYRDTPHSECWEQLVADLIQIKMASLNSRVFELKRELHSIAAKVPSLESKVSENVIIARNIHKYLSYLLENKTYLISLSKGSRDSPPAGDDISDSETEEDGGVVIPSCDAHLPPLYHTSTTLRHRRKERANTEADSGDTQEEEDVVGSDLDDAELSQYIATEREVKKKKRYFKKHQIT